MQIDFLGRSYHNLPDYLVSTFSSDQVSFVSISDARISLQRSGREIFSFSGTGLSVDQYGKVSGHIDSFDVFASGGGPIMKFATVDLPPGHNFDLNTLKAQADAINAENVTELRNALLADFYDNFYGPNGIQVTTSGLDSVSLGGSSGDDVIQAGAGHDTISFSLGQDRIDGGDAGDILILPGPAVPDYGFVVNLNAGFAFQKSPDRPTTTLVSIEDVSGSDRRDTITGNHKSNFIFGAGGDDVLRGGAGKDMLIGGYGADQLFGGTGNDTLRGMPGDDYIEGMTGNDHISGGTGSDTLKGDRGADQLNGDNGSDLLDGGRGNDTLYGGNGRDLLRGGAGRDILNGGMGNDRLNGGEGVDTFIFGYTRAKRFHQEFGNDTVGNFQLEDKIELFVKDASSVTYGTNAKGEILIKTDSGSILLQGSAELEVADLNLTIDYMF